jgi:hypothetical protein
MPRFFRKSRQDFREFLFFRPSLKRFFFGYRFSDFFGAFVIKLRRECFFYAKFYPNFFK